MSSEESLGWYVKNPTDRLRWEHWDEESVVFDKLSGQTHLLTALGAEALVLLQEKPRTTEQIASDLAQEYALELTSELHSQLEQLLGQFYDLGLVDRHI